MIAALKSKEHHLGSWVGDPDGYRFRQVADAEHERTLVARRADLTLVASFEDHGDACAWMYAAIVQLDDHAYVCRTLGCSCNGPEDNWVVLARVPAATISDWLVVESLRSTGDGHDDDGLAWTCMALLANLRGLIEPSPFHYRRGTGDVDFTCGGVTLTERAWRIGPAAYEALRKSLAIA